MSSNSSAETDYFKRNRLFIKSVCIQMDSNSAHCNKNQTMIITKFRQPVMNQFREWGTGVLPLDIRCRECKAIIIDMT